ncbi:hypothetical protein L2E82_21036 [Cichorium intybus]|uniref:Uncharacterized protein n=1 Tax=Cichorium intybus TaxID=13427 RepID=A0ACB9DVZ0_CICIN|nr:hypothetical protein L2E82_21036 [Cichorium intybus]
MPSLSITATFGHDKPPPLLQSTTTAVYSLFIHLSHHRWRRSSPLYLALPSLLPSINKAIIGVPSVSFHEALFHPSVTISGTRTHNERDQRDSEKNNSGSSDESRLHCGNVMDQSSMEYKDGKGSLGRKLQKEKFWYQDYKY